MKVLIAGAGRLGTQIAQVLLAARNEVTLIDRDEDRVADLRGRLPGVLLVAGDACEPALLEHAGVLTADLVVATTGDDEGNLVIALLAKRWFSVPRVAARVNDTDNTWLFDAHWGVDVAVPAATPLISLIEEATGATDTVALLRLSKAGIDVIETAITRGDVSDAPVRGLVLIGIEGRGGDRIMARLSGMAQVTAVHSTNGKWDLIVEISAASLAELDEVLRQIRNQDGVVTSETNLLLSSRRTATRWT